MEILDEDFYELEERKTEALEKIERHLAYIARYTQGIGITALAGLDEQGTKALAMLSDIPEYEVEDA